MIKVSIYLFDRKVSFATNLASYFLNICLLQLFLFFYGRTTVAKILFLIWNLMQSITSKMETCIAHITIKDLIRVIIKTTETCFTICLEKLVIRRVSSFCGFNQFHAFKQFFYHLVCFISSSMLKISQNCMMHQGFFY